MSGKNARKNPSEPPSEWRIYLAEEFENFKLAYREAGGHGYGSIRARSMYMTGLVLADLERARLIERENDGFRPRPKHR